LWSSRCNWFVPKLAAPQFLYMVRCWRLAVEAGVCS
jgi:hypothetical protein